MKKPAKSTPTSPMRTLTPPSRWAVGHIDSTIVDLAIVHGALTEAERRRIRCDVDPDLAPTASPIRTRVSRLRDVAHSSLKTRRQTTQPITAQ